MPITLMANTFDDGPDDLDQRDIEALRDWINTKRQVTVKEIGGSLSVAGEVRFEFQGTNEKVNGVRQRGPGGLRDKDGANYANYSWDVEVNIMLDYRTDRTWTAIKLEFDNNAGIFGGSLDRIKLEKAYFGVRLIQNEMSFLDLEMGRRRLSSIFDSKLEYNSFFDGALVKYDKSFEKAGEFYFSLGGFIIDERNNHYGYAGEIGIMNIASTGLYTKYSLIDWDLKKHMSFTPGNGVLFDFLVSQLIFGYRFVPAKLEKVVILYLAGLYNHAAKRRSITDHRLANAGGYLGFSIGELRKKGDWSFDANYQVLQAQAVPDFDVSGIGFNNTPRLGFYNTQLDGKGVPTTRSNAAGNGNYRGFQLTLEYLLTETINIQQQWQQSITLDNDIGPFRQFKQYEVEFIYAF